MLDKGGYTKNWKKIRDKVMKKNNNICNLCGINENRMIVLCEKCHKGIHKWLNKIRCKLKDDYTVTIPKGLVEKKGWKKAQELFFVFNEKGEIAIKD